MKRKRKALAYSHCEIAALTVWQKFVVSAYCCSLLLLLPGFGEEARVIDDTGNSRVLQILRGILGCEQFRTGNLRGDFVFLHLSLPYTTPIT